MPFPHGFPATVYTLQSKVSRNPIKRLTRKARSRQGQESAADRKRDQPHVSLSEATATSSTQNASYFSKLTSFNLKLRRQTLLFEDGPDSDPQSHRHSVCSWTELSTDAPDSGSRSVLLHKTADRGLPPASPLSPQGQFQEL